MKRRTPILKLKVPKIELSNEEIMRDLLFPVEPRPLRPA